MVGDGLKIGIALSAKDLRHKEGRFGEGVVNAREDQNEDARQNGGRDQRDLQKMNGSLQRICHKQRDQQNSHEAKQSPHLRAPKSFHCPLPSRCFCICNRSLRISSRKSVRLPQADTLAFQGIR